VNASIKLGLFYFFLKPEKEKKGPRFNKEGNTTMDLYAIQESRDQESLAEHYSLAYQKRYRVKPILASSGADRTTLGDLQRSLTTSRVRDLLTIT